MYKILFPEGRKNAFTLSYDDGQIYDRELIALCNQYKLKGTFHLNAGTLGIKNDTDEFLRRDEIKSLYDGHEVACHGYSHPWFTQLTKLQVVDEILHDKRELEIMMEYPIRGMSYPFGVLSDRVCETAENLGIEYARTVEDTNGFQIPDDFMRWHPSCHHNADIFELADRFFNPAPYVQLQLFYIWGHSFEFERENSWGRFEKFCRKIAGHDNVWYATNIQIKDYLYAAQSIITTVDHTIVYNPTAIPIWMEIERGTIFVNAGERIRLS